MHRRGIIIAAYRAGDRLPCCPPAEPATRLSSRETQLDLQSQSQPPTARASEHATGRAAKQSDQVAPVARLRNYPGRPAGRTKPAADAYFQQDSGVVGSGARSAPVGTMSWRNCSVTQTAPTDVYAIARR